MRNIENVLETKVVPGKRGRQTLPCGNETRTLPGVRARLSLIVVKPHQQGGLPTAFIPGDAEQIDIVCPNSKEQSYLFSLGTLDAARPCHAVPKR